MSPFFFRKFMKPFITVLFFLTSIILTVWILGMSSASQVDLIIHGGIVYTLNDGNGRAEAVAVRGDRIIDVGSDSSILSTYKARSFLNLDGRTMLPGLIDAHAHMTGLGLSMMMLDLTKAGSQTEVAELVAETVLRRARGDWIRGRGWDQNQWMVKNFPTHEILSRAAPSNPVYLVRVDGHAAWVNSSALSLAGIDSATPDPAGGRIIRDVNGNPTGVLIDTAMELVARHIPQPTTAELTEAVRRAVAACLSFGITTVHDMGVDLKTVEIYKNLIREEEFPFRIYAAIDGPGPTWEYFRRNGPIIDEGNPTLTVRAIKLYADGALGSRGAALLEPYSDDPANSGLEITTSDEIYTIALQALDNGFQVCTHAIGDKGVRNALNAYGRALNNRIVHDPRFRIEHAQVVAPSDIHQFASLGVIPSMQPIHCTSDMSWAEDRIGHERILGAYAWRSFIEMNLPVPGGSDFPVEPVNPMLGIFAAVTRQDASLKPDEGWYPAQRVSREEAVRMFTTWAAYGGFEENLKGTIERGKLADLVIFPKDIFTIEETALLSIRPDITIVGGKVVYQQNRL
jgi:predicted amidohydrolase YtcJ